MEYQITKPDKNEWNLIKHNIHQFNLDDGGLDIDQFIVCKQDDKLAGFGRIRRYDGYDLFSSLGVLPEYRHHGVAEAITNELLKEATQDVYIVTAKPAFFLRHGFENAASYSQLIQKIKKDCSVACECELAVLKYRKISFTV